MTPPVRATKTVRGSRHSLDVTVSISINRNSSNGFNVSMIVSIPSRGRVAGSKGAGTRAGSSSLAEG